MVVKKEEIIPVLEILDKQNYGKSMLAGFGGVDADPFKILIATVLSVRAKDQATIPLVEKLFENYDTPKKIFEANPNDLMEIIRPIGFFNIKTKRIQVLSKQLIDNFDGKVPRTEEELLSLEGVGRKVANCVLVYSFGVPAIPVDIHVHRISNRLGWIKSDTPEETEIKLEKIVPKKYWHLVNEKFVLHGQNVCFPRGPNCDECSIKKYCKRINLSRKF